MKIIWHHWCVSGKTKVIQQQYCITWGHTSLGLGIVLLTGDTDTGLLSILDLCNNHYFYFYDHNHNNIKYTEWVWVEGEQEGLYHHQLLQFNEDMFSLIPGQVVWQVIIVNNINYLPPHLISHVHGWRWPMTHAGICLAITLWLTGLWVSYPRSGHWTGTYHSLVPASHCWLEPGHHWHTDTKHDHPQSHWSLTRYIYIIYTQMWSSNITSLTQIIILNFLTISNSWHYIYHMYFIFPPLWRTVNSNRYWDVQKTDVMFIL